jgi:hypothetical protein
MTAERSFGARATAVLVASISVFVTLLYYSSAAEMRRRYPDPFGVISAVNRFAEISRRLPPGARVRYLTDLPLDTRGTAAFLAAQHALAPHLLMYDDPAGKAEWAIGNYGNPLDTAAKGKAAGFAVVEDFGRGTVLYRRQKP